MTEAEEREYLERNSPKAMPDNPSQNGWTSEQIKNQLAAGLFILYQWLVDERNARGLTDTGLANLATTVTNIISGTTIVGKATADKNGNDIVNTYFTKAEAQAGSYTALKYVRQDQTQGFIYDIANALSNLQTSYSTFISTKFDANGKANNAANADNATKALKDDLGRTFSTTYAALSALTSLSNEITGLKTGTVLADKSRKDANGDPINTTYVKVSNVVNDLLSDDTSKPLSAYQGKVLKGYINDINTILTSNDVNLDTLQEVVNYIKTNRSLFDAKVNKTDIVDNLTSAISDKPLSANMGKKLNDEKLAISTHNSDMATKVNVSDIKDDLVSEDTNKPLSAKQGKALKTLIDNEVANRTTALASKADLVGGKIPQNQLPSYVDDVLEGYLYNGSFYSDSSHTIQLATETGKIYLDIPNNTYYRWSGTQYSSVTFTSQSVTEETYNDIVYKRLKIENKPVIVEKAVSILDELKFTDNSVYLARPTAENTDVDSVSCDENYIEGYCVIDNQIILDSIKDYQFSLQQWANYPISDVNIIAGHVYYLSAKLKTLTSNNLKICFGSTNYQPNGYTIVISDTNRIETKFTADSSISGYVPRIYNWEAITSSGQIDYIQLIDLTQMFGTSIANHLATLPIANALEKINKFYDTTIYHAYNVGTIRYVGGSDLSKTVNNENQWNENWEVGGINDFGQPVSTQDRIRSKDFTRVVPNTQYFFYCDTSLLNFYLFYYDANKNFISSVSITSQQEKLQTTPSNCHYIKFRLSSAYGTTYNHDIAIYFYHANRSYLNTYIAHQELTYQMPTNALRGVLVLDANNNIVPDGDRHYANGEEDVKYGEVDLGSLNYEKTATTNVRFKSTSHLTNAKSSTGDNTYCGIFSPHINSGVYDDTTHDDYLVVDGNGDVVIASSSRLSLTPEQFKTAMSGVKLVYEKASPTKVQATPFQLTQVIWDNGGEFMNTPTNTLAPFHNATYTPNLGNFMERFNLAIEGNPYALTVSATFFDDLFNN